jgi:hypothetical protein
MLTPYRRKLTAEQHNICPLCEGTMTDDTVVDHDHKTGLIRASLCRWCNGVLGRLENWSARIGRGIDPIKFLGNTAAYLAKHRDFPGTVQYPTHKTEAEKRDARNAKVRKQRAAARKTPSE